jgi:hypothetical protein
MNTLSLAKRDFSLLASYLPGVRDSFQTVMDRRVESNEQNFAGPDRRRRPRD